MFPWDFGIINAIKKELEFPIFPSNPPENQKETPYLILELKNILQGENYQSRVEFSVTVVDNNEITGASFNIIRGIKKIIRKELTLYQGNCIIGSAKMKVKSIESKGNNFVINLIAILQLKAIYEDDEKSLTK